MSSFPQCLILEVLVLGHQSHKTGKPVDIFVPGLVKSQFSMATNEVGSPYLGILYCFGTESRLGTGDELSLHMPDWPL